MSGLYLAAGVGVLLTLADLALTAKALEHPRASELNGLFRVLGRKRVVPVAAILSSGLLCLTVYAAWERKAPGIVWAFDGLRGLVVLWNLRQIGRLKRLK